MDFGAIGENLPVFVIIAGLILLQFFLRRRRKPETTQREIVQNLLAETRLNQAVLEFFSVRQEPKKFVATTWRRNITNLSFLSQPLQAALSESFMMAEDFNQQIDAAKKHKSANYIPSLNVDKLKGLLTKSREGLEEWFVAHTGTKKPPLEYPGVFDGLFGGRR